MAKYGISAGHNPADRVACGAVGLINESTEARIMKDLIIKYIGEIGDVACDCTENYGTSKNDILVKVANKHKACNADFNINIHFNAGANKTEDGKFTGTESFVKSLSDTKTVQMAKRINAAIAKTISKDRGVKVANLYFTNNVPNAILIEICFVDDPDDVKEYNKNKDTLAKSIAEAITGKTVPVVTTTNEKLPNGSYSDKVATVTADLNIRKTRPKDDGTLGEIVGSFKKGDETKLGYCLNGWMGVPCKGGTNGTGFVNSTFLNIK